VYLMRKGLKLYNPHPFDLEDRVVPSPALSKFGRRQEDKRTWAAQQPGGMQGLPRWRSLNRVPGVPGGPTWRPEWLASELIHVPVSYRNTLN